MMVLVSEACFRAATCTGPHETRQLNILPLIKPPCWGVKIGGGCQRFRYRAGNAGAGRVSFCLKPMNLLHLHSFFSISVPFPNANVIYSFEKLEAILMILHK